jgi:hypothetical protein
LFSSFTEKEPVNGARGGIASIDQRILGRPVEASAEGLGGGVWPSMAAVQL